MSRPDKTSAVDWALKINYLPIGVLGGGERGQRAYTASASAMETWGTLSPATSSLSVWSVGGCGGVRGDVITICLCTDQIGDALTFLKKIRPDIIIIIIS